MVQMQRSTRLPKPVTHLPVGQEKGFKIKAQQPQQLQ